MDVLLLWEYCKAGGFYASWFSMTAIVLIICMPVLCYVKWLPGVMKLWAKLSLALLRIFHGLEVDYIIDEPLKESGQIIACKHQSVLEILVLAEKVPNAVFLYKSSLQWVPWVNVYLWRMKQIPVYRSRHKTGVINEVIDKLAEHNIVIFPEGTRVEYDDSKDKDDKYVSEYADSVVELSGEAYGQERCIKFTRDKIKMKSEYVLERALKRIEK